MEIRLEVPKSKDILEFLEKNQEKFEEAWVFMDTTVNHKLPRCNDIRTTTDINKKFILTWDTTEKHSSIQFTFSAFSAQSWYTMSELKFGDSVYPIAKEPKNFVLITMKE